MKRIEVSTSGFTLTKEVPESVEEYNALAPSRTNAVLEDAVANTLYRGTFAEFRDKLAEHIEKDSGIARINSGTEEDPVWESEGKYLKRVQAAKFGGSRDAFVSHYASAAQSIMDAAAFDVTIREASGGSGPKIGKNDLKLATELLADTAKTEKVLGLLGAKLNRAITLSGDKEADVKTVGLAFADWRRMQAEQAKNELGM